MSRELRHLTLFVCTAMLSVAFVSTADGQEVINRRVADSEDVVRAAVDLSRQTFTDKDARYVVVGRDDDFADNLAGAPLAGKEGPLLFTTGGANATLRPEVRTEIQRILPPRDCGQGASVYLLGGPRAVSQAVEEELQDLGYCPQRFNGATRVETSVLIANHVSEGTNPTQVLVARADDWADAATGGAYAALSGSPVIITQGDTLHSAAQEYLDFHNPKEIVLLGGTAALSDQVFITAEQYASTRRVAGSARDATASAIATDLWAGWYQGRSSPMGATILNGYAPSGWAYALAAAGLSAVEGAPQLYANADKLASSTDDYLAGQTPAFVVVVGPQSLVTSDTADAAFELTDGKLQTPDAEVVVEGAPQPPTSDEDLKNDDEPSMGGVVGAPGDMEVPDPPTSDITGDPLSLGEHLGMDTSPFSIPNLSPATATIVDDPPARLPLQNSSLGLSYALNISQSNFPVWAWNQLPYNDLPYAVGRLYGSDDGGVTWRGICTATAIGPNQVLTAGHCFVDTDTGLARSLLYSFCPDLYGESFSQGCWQGTLNDAYLDRTFLERLPEHVNFFGDFGILRVAPNEYGQRLGDAVRPFPVQMNGDQYTANRFTIGYPSEGMYAQGCSDASCYPYYCWSPVGQILDWGSTGYYRSIAFGCYSNGGWSGGPIFQFADGQLSLVSVLSTGGNPVKYPCDLTRCQLHTMNSWGPVFRYETFFPVWQAAQ